MKGYLSVFLSLLVACSIGLEIEEEIYDENLARKMFNFSVVAFCDDKCVINWNCSLVHTL